MQAIGHHDGREDGSLGSGSPQLTPTILHASEAMMARHSNMLLMVCTHTCCLISMAYTGLGLKQKIGLCRLRMALHVATACPLMRPSHVMKAHGGNAAMTSHGNSSSLNVVQGIAWQWMGWDSAEANGSGSKRKDEIKKG
jgi:hypothetical protein